MFFLQDLNTAHQSNNTHRKQPNLRCNIPEVGPQKVGLLKRTVELLIWLRIVVSRRTLFSDVVEAVH